MKEIPISAINGRGKQVGVTGLSTSVKIGSQHIEIVAPFRIGNAEQERTAREIIHGATRLFTESLPSAVSGNNRHTLVVVGSRFAKRHPVVQLRGASMVLSQRILRRLSTRFDPAELAKDVSVMHWPGSKPRVSQRGFNYLYDFVLRAAARKGEFLTHGSAAQVDTGTGPKAVILLGPSGSGKTETVIQLINNGARHIEDDAVLLGLQREIPLVGGTGSRCLFSFKDPINVRPGVARLHFVQPDAGHNYSSWNHLEVGSLPELGLVDEKKTLKQISRSDSTPVSAVVFMLPMQKLSNRGLFSALPKASLSPADIGDSLKSRLWTASSRRPAARVKILERLFQRTKIVNSENDLVNVHELPDGDRSRVFDFIAQWIEKNALAEHGSTWAQGRAREFLEKTKQVFVVAKSPPPELSDELARLLIKKVRLENQSRKRWIAALFKMRRKQAQNNKK